jgi:hypothetical protein
MIDFKGRRNLMACECDEKYLRVWRECNFSVRLGKDREATPLSWKDQELHFCVFCGDIKVRIPSDVLQVIQQADNLME